MKDLDFTQIFDSMRQNDVSEVIIKEGGKQYEIRRGGFKNVAVVTQAVSAPVQHEPAQAALVEQPAQTQKSQEKKASDMPSSYHEVKAPFVGTFYSSPNPDAPSFVEVGDKVTKGETLCIVEAMKNFNEIESDVTGIIKEACVETGDLVDFGKVLFRIEKQ